MITDGQCSKIIAVAKAANAGGTPIQWERYKIRSSAKNWAGVRLTYNGRSYDVTSVNEARNIIQRLQLAHWNNNAKPV